VFLRALAFELRDFDLIGTRGVVAFFDAESFSDAVAAYRGAFQKSEGALDWAGGDGRSRVGHCD
jgi:hypothetical protein